MRLMNTSALLSLALASNIPSIFVSSHPLPGSSHSKINHRHAHTHDHSDSLTRSLSNLNITQIEGILTSLGLLPAMATNNGLPPFLANIPTILSGGNEIAIPDANTDTDTVTTVLARENAQLSNAETSGISEMDENQEGDFGRGGLMNDLLIAEDSSVSKSDINIESRRLNPGPGPENRGLVNVLLPLLGGLLDSVDRKKRQMDPNDVLTSLNDLRIKKKRH